MVDKLINKSILSWTYKGESRNGKSIDSVIKVGTRDWWHEGYWITADTYEEAKRIFELKAFWE
jgi:hypothetical protein